MKNRFDDFFNFPKSETRSQVVDQAVKVEHFVNSILATLLGIEKRDSKSFGNTSSALSFSAKINLLLDLGILEHKYKSKILAFLELRNQFVHNLEVAEISECPDELKKKLIRFYGGKNVDSDYPTYYTNLYNDVLIAVQELYNQIGERAGKKGETEAKSKLMLMIESEMKNYAETDDDFAKKYTELTLKAINKFREMSPPSNSDIINKPLI
mgnify:CR=1 FL=1